MSHKKLYEFLLEIPQVRSVTGAKDEAILIRKGLAFIENGYILARVFPGPRTYENAVKEHNKAVKAAKRAEIESEVCKGPTYFLVCNAQVEGYSVVVGRHSIIIRKLVMFEGYTSRTVLTIGLTEAIVGELKAVQKRSKPGDVSRTQAVLNLAARMGVIPHLGSKI